MSSIAVIGASNDRTKYGNRAVRAYANMGWTVFPINPKDKEIEGIEAYKTILKVPYKIDKFTLYVPPAVGLQLVSHLKKMGAKDVYLNPGAESEELIAAIKKAGIKPLLMCSIKAVGMDPEKL